MMGGEENLIIYSKIRIFAAFGAARKAYRFVYFSHHWAGIGCYTL
jgi:hypothetical protein